MDKGLKIIIASLLAIQTLSFNVAFIDQPETEVEQPTEVGEFEAFSDYVGNMDLDEDELAELALDRLDEFVEMVDDVFDLVDEETSTLPLDNVNRPFPQSGDNPLPRQRRLPTDFDRAPGDNFGIQPEFTAQEQMDFDTLTRFNNILFAFVVDPDPETRYDPDNFRMVLAMPRHSWVTINPAGSYDPVHGNMAGVRHMGIMVCESQGFGMLMLPLMAGSENELVPDIRVSRGGSGTGANAFPERTVTLGQNLFNNLPEGLQEALRERYGPETDAVDLQFYFDAMFRTVRQFPSFEILEDGTVPYPRQSELPHEGGVGRRTYLMSWELSTGIPGIHSPGDISVASWIDGFRTGPGTTTGNPIGNANASFNWFLSYGQPFYDARNINQSHSIATDGNMDIIMGLIFAHYQWGGGGTGGIDFDFNQVSAGENVGYLYWSLGMMQDFWYTVVDRTEQAHLDMGWEGNYHLRVGNWSIHEDAYFNDLGVWMSNATRASDHIFHHLRTFDYLDPVNDWGQVIEATYEAQRQLALLRYPDVNGILPDFSYLDRDAGTWHPAPTTDGGWLEGNSDGTYSWNNLRVPWRFGTDLMTSNRNAIDNLILGNLHQHVNATWPNFTGIRSMTLDGVGASPASGTGVGFWSPFIVPGAMYDDIGIDQDWFNLAWSHTRRQSQANNFYADYFKVLSMIVASGNYWTPVDVPVVPSHYRAIHVRNGYGSGIFAPGTAVELVARVLPGYRFDEWVLPEGVTVVEGTLHSSTLTVLVPNEEVIVSATFMPTDPETEMARLALQALINEAMALTEADFTVATWADLQTALDRAQAVIESNDKAVLVEATADLTAAIEGLERRPAPGIPGLPPIPPLPPLPPLPELPSLPWLPPLPPLPPIPPLPPWFPSLPWLPWLPRISD